jgi:hypothetical protein
MRIKKEYLNVDLHLIFEGDPQPFVAAIDDEMILIAQFSHEGTQNVIFEADIEDLGVPDRGPDRTINAICDVIEVQSEAGKAEWQNCRRKLFDIGYACGQSGRPMEHEIELETLRRVVALGGVLKITLHDGDDGREATEFIPGA